MSGITVDQWLSISGRTYRRARKLRAELEHLASVVAGVGHTKEAATLRQIAGRAMPVADAYVDALARGVTA